VTLKKFFFFLSVREIPIFFFFPIFLLYFLLFHKASHLLVPLFHNDLLLFAELLEGVAVHLREYVEHSLIFLRLTGHGQLQMFVNALVSTLRIRYDLMAQLRRPGDEFVDHRPAGQWAFGVSLGTLRESRNQLLLLHLLLMHALPQAGNLLETVSLNHL